MRTKWLAAWILVSVGSTSRADFRAGFAERDITPAIGSEAPGGYGKSYHRSLHDPCKVRAAVFDDGAKQIALVGIDALFIHRDTVKKVRQAIASKTGMAGDAILLGASHSHSSGPMSGVMPGEYDHASPMIQRLAYQQTTTADPAYLAKCEQAIVDAVCYAYEHRQPVQAGVGRGLQTGVAFNRRFRMRSGGSVTHPGLGNPDILEPAGPVDPEVGVIGAWDAKKKLIGCVVNFACHATTSPGGISANYVHYLEKSIQGYFGKDTVVVFLNGMSGDITQVDNQSPWQYPDGETWAQIVGGRVGAEAVKVLIGLPRGTLAPIDFRVKTLSIRRRAPTPAKVQAALELIQNDPLRGKETEWTFAKEIALLDAKLKKEPIAEVESQVVQVGPVAFLTSPAEYFCEFGLRMKAESGFPFTFPVSLANGCVGYVPTEEAFGPNGGGYETRLTAYSNLEITAGTQIANTGIAQAKSLKPGIVPSHAQRPPFTGQPWTYGNVRPERE